MKKIFALALSAAMVASMASVAFAATVDQSLLVIESQPYSAKDGAVNAMTAKVGYGKSVYYALDNDGLVNGSVSPVENSDMVKGLTAKPTWSQNAARVDKVSIVKKRTIGDANTAVGKTYAYFVEVKFKSDVGNLSDNDVYGKIELNKGTKAPINVFVTLGYTNMAFNFEPKANSASNAIGSIDVNDVTALGDTDKIYNFVDQNASLPSESSLTSAATGDTSKGYLKSTASSEPAKLKEAKIELDKEIAAAGFVTTKLGTNEEDEIELFGGAGTFTVDTRGQGKIILSNTVEVEKRKELEAMYPDCVFSFVNGNGSSFNKIGTLKLSASKGDVLYAVGADGLTLTKLNVPYDETEEAFLVKTRTLGTYAIADGEIALKAPVVEAPASSVPSVEPVNPTVPGNPITGAIA